jgi:hypothetical protein
MLIVAVLQLGLAEISGGHAVGRGRESADRFGGTVAPWKFASSPALAASFRIGRQRDGELCYNIVLLGNAALAAESGALCVFSFVELEIPKA